MRRQTAEDQRDVTNVLAPQLPGFSLGGEAAADAAKQPRKAALPARGGGGGGSDEAATVIQSIARGRRGRKLSTEIRRQSIEGMADDDDDSTGSEVEQQGATATATPAEVGNDDAALQVRVI